MDTREFTPIITIQSIPLAAPSRPLVIQPGEKIALYSELGVAQDPQFDVKVLRGATAAEVYSKLKALFDAVDDGTEMYNIVCQVEVSDSVAGLIERYPFPPNHYPVDAKSWFNEVVTWWQREDRVPNNDGTFNHGSRIFRWNASINQIEKIIELLKSGRTSRATVTLLDPRDGGLDADRMTPYPSLCTVQFVIRKDATRTVLDCVAYFRKQEIAAWWPINFAEIVDLQKKVLSGIEPRYSKSGIFMGGITTFSAVSVKSAGTPRVAINAVDRANDLRPDELWAMVCALFVPGQKNRRSFESLWNGYIDNFIPNAQRDEDGVPVPIVGLKFLLDTSRKFNAVAPRKGSSDFVQSLERLLNVNERFAASTGFGRSAKAQQEMEKWKDEVSSIVVELKSFVSMLLGKSK